MKKIFTIVAVVLLTATVWAQIPQKMSYQAVIRDASNKLVTSHIVGMRISILRDSASGTVVYTETQTPTTNTNGLASIEIGGGTPVTGTFAAINWASGTYFIKTETDPTGQTSYTISGTSQLLSVPYALHAKTTDSIIGSGGVIIGSGGVFAHYIGELYGGGIVVTVLKNAGVEHGLIASLTDVSDSSVWSNVNATLIGKTAESSFNGLTNTNAIIAQQGHTTSAALLCHNYTGGGFHDWYLPAIWELNQCFNAAFVVNNILGATNGFQSANYWSSAEGGNSNAWFQYFSCGTTSYGDAKTNTFSVRAVRRF